MLLIDTEIAVVDQTIIDILKGMAEDSPNKRSRACLAPTSAWVQEMIICMMRESYVRPHKHPKTKPESYHVIEGELAVVIYTPEGEHYREIRLNKQTPFYRLKGGWFHEPIPMTDWVVYHEVYPGPFVKETDVEYAAWSAHETV